MASNSLFTMNDKNSNITIQSLPVKCPFYSRIGHRLLRVNDEALILGGTGQSGEFLKFILRFNLENFKTEQISSPQCPNLQGFSAFTYTGKVFLWGGNFQNKPCNNLWCLQESSFQICIQNGEIPSPRAFHCSSVIAEKYLLVYGGYNQSQISNDWYIFNIETFTWHRVQSNYQLPKNVKFKMVWQGGRGFLMSQFQVTKSGWKSSLNIKNQIYQLRMISFSTFKIRIDQLTQFQGQLPPLRSNFSLLFIQKQLYVLGGEMPSNKLAQTQFCSDMWGLNIETLKWMRKPTIISTKTEFQTLEYKNKLYLIGGIRSYSEMSSSIQIIHLKNINQFDTQVCNFCKSVFSLDTKTLNKKSNTIQIQIKEATDTSTQISTNFLSKLARCLQNPIQAIGLLIDNSLNMGASSISINIRRPELSVNFFKERQTFLYIGDNSKSFGTDQIVRILFSFRFKVQGCYRDHIDKQDVKIRNQYGINLKLASLRLGSTCLFVTTTHENNIFVAFFSDSQIDCPDGDPSFNCFYYTINPQGVCSNNINRQIIKENVKHLIEQKQFLDMAFHLTKVYIFRLYDITRVASKNGKYDISYMFPHGLNLSSLSEYTSCLYLNPYLGRQIYIQENRLSFINLVSKFKQDEKNRFIQQLDTGSQVGVFSKICIYRIINSPYQNSYVYIYQQNRLITTIQSKEKLVCGYIEVPDSIQVDFFRSRVQKLQEQRKLIGYIQSKEETRKRQRAYITEEQLRKIKPCYQF